MAKAIQFDDPAAARAILNNYTGNAEARAQLAAAIDAQEEEPQSEEQRAFARALKRERRSQVQRNASKLARAHVRAFGGGGGVAGDYRTMLLARQVQQQEEKMAEARARDEANAKEQQERIAAAQGRDAQLAQQMRRQREGQEAGQRAIQQGKQQDVGKARRAIGGAFDRLHSISDTINQRADRIPTPGGLSSMILFLLILVFAAVPVNTDKAGNSHTRLELLWLTIRGQTSLPTGSGNANQNAASQATQTSGAATAPGGNLGISGRAASVGATQQGTLARVPVAPAPPPLAGPWTAITRWGQEG